MRFPSIAQFRRSNRNHTENTKEFVYERVCEQAFCDMMCAVRYGMAKVQSFHPCNQRLADCIITYAHSMAHVQNVFVPRLTITSYKYVSIKTGNTHTHTRTREYLPSVH